MVEGVARSVDPQLNIWEAQFGDFLNGAQIVVDQYIVSAESKWGIKSGLVIMLPHGLEGQGPDHSSSRIERIAQLCANGNIVLVQPSTPANLFHVLRRQVQAPWRKPLFLITPKSLLRNRAAVSGLSEMGAGTCFEPVLEAAGDASDTVKRIVLCSGKVFYDIESARRDGGRDDVHVVRLEQIYPFPARQLADIVARFPSAECVWLQEEPENQGAWPMVRDMLGRHDSGLARPVRVIARPPLPVSAGGSIERHEREHAELIERALATGVCSQTPKRSGAAR